MDFPDRSLAYVTDTTASVNEPYLESIRGVDLLIHECNFPDGMEEYAERTGHSCLTPVVHVAQKAGVGGLVLMHFNPLTTGIDDAQLEAAKQQFHPIVLAEDGMEIEL